MTPFRHKVFAGILGCEHGCHAGLRASALQSVQQTDTKPVSVAFVLLHDTGVRRSFIVFCLTALPPSHGSLVTATASPQGHPHLWVTLQDALSNNHTHHEDFHTTLDQEYGIYNNGKPKPVKRWWDFMQHQGQQRC